ncbi:MAG: ABC transporter ATP-binding protein [Anaerolineae bacterium]|nr:ABC transporter ATP-binding protein [Anaerolineae bacterium]
MIREHLHTPEPAIPTAAPLPPVEPPAIVLQTHALAVGYAVPRHAPKVVLDGIDVALHAGELVCLIGPNGAGKSTLLRTLAGMQPALHGTVHLLDQDVRGLTPAERARRLSLVLTERVDAGMMTAYALVALGRYPYTGWMGRLTTEDEATVHEAIQAVGAAELSGRYLSELSDGERQKIMIARALAQQPALMLLDEPTAFLDLPRRAELMGLLRRLARETQRAILLSTHDLDLALRSADRVWLLPRGGPLTVGAPEDLVLTGAFESAFRSEGVVFDAYTGSFRSAHPPAGTIDLHGSGIAATWTARALERAGCCVVLNGQDSPTRVTIDSSSDPTVWTLHQDGQTRAFTSLYDLVAALS